MSSISDFHVMVIADEMIDLLDAGETPDEGMRMGWERMGLDRADQDEAWEVMSAKHRARRDGRPA